jgi:hypothetical protein|tara:strand:- start:996 stop:2717 length:1722 start_codon:yes stop_codon:yes gene_type:complete
MLKQQKVLYLKNLLVQHWVAYQTDIIEPNWFSVMDFPFSIFEFIPFFKKPLYERKRVKFLEKSQKVLIEVDFPRYQEFSKNFIPLFGHTMGKRSRFNSAYDSFNSIQYNLLISNIAKAIDSSIQAKRRIMSKENCRRFGFSSTAAKQVNKVNSIESKSVFFGNEDLFTWDIGDFIKFDYGMNGLRLQNLKLPKNSHHSWGGIDIPQYTEFNVTESKFIITLQGFNKREIHYLKRYFNFDLNKTNSVKGFKYDSSKNGVGQYEHYVFSGKAHDSDADSTLGDVDFLEKIIWYFDFLNDSVDQKSNILISDSSVKEGMPYWQFSDQKLIQVNDLSKGKYIESPAHRLDDYSYLDSSDIQSSDIESLLTLGVKPEEIMDAVGAVMVDWNVGNNFPRWNEDNVKRDLENRALEINNYLNQINIKGQKSVDLGLKPMEELVMTCVEFYFKYGEEIDAIVARDIEPDALRVEEIIAIYPELNKREFNPSRKKNINGILLNLNEFLNPRGKTSIWFFCDNVQTKEAFLKLLPKDLKWKEAPSKVTNPELRFLVEIEKWDMIALKKILETKNKKSLESKIF